MEVADRTKGMGTGSEGGRRGRTPQIRGKDPFYEREAPTKVGAMHTPSVV